MTRDTRGHIIQPKNDVPRLVVIIFGLAGIVAIITLLGLFAPNVFPFLSDEQSTNQNVTWLTRVWTQAAPSPDAVETLAEILEDNGITTVYLETGGWHGQTGDYIELPYTQDFIAQFQSFTTIDIYIWGNISGEQLVDPTNRQRLTAFMEQSLARYDLRGVHIQTRSVPTDSEPFILLLRDLSSIITGDLTLSITVPPDRPPAQPDIPNGPSVASNLTWSREYKQRTALNVDEMVLMAHASGLESDADYELWIAYQAEAYATLLIDFELDTTLLVALPTYEAELGHDPAVENVDSALAGLLQLSDQNIRQVDGVGLYPWEQTDLFELDAYWEQWVNR